MARFGSSDGSGNPGDDPTQSIRYRQGGPQQPGPPPAPVGPIGQGPIPGSPGYRPGDAPTQYAAQIPFGQQPPPAPEAAGFAGPPPTPWFRRRSVLIAWVGLIAVMLALVIWGIVQLTSRGPGGGGTAPATTSSSTTSTSGSTSTTASTTSSSPSATSSSTTPSAAPPRQAPPKQPPAQQAPAEPSHRHRLPSLPSVITIPPIPRVPELPTVITLPPHR